MEEKTSSSSNTKRHSDSGWTRLSFQKIIDKQDFYFQILCWIPSSVNQQPSLDFKQLMETPSQHAQILFASYLRSGVRNTQPFLEVANQVASKTFEICGIRWKECSLYLKLGITFSFKSRSKCPTNGILEFDHDCDINLNYIHVTILWRKLSHIIQ